MKKETKIPNGPKILGEINVTDFITTQTSEGKKVRIKRKKNIASFEADNSSYIDEIEQREDLSKERKSTIRFFYEIVLPLYKILFYSKVNDNIYDYIDKCNEGANTTKKRTAILDISSEQVFDTLIKYRERRSVEELLYHYYPNISEFETLKGCLQSNDKILFCQKLAEYNKIEIYELCLYYLQIEREFHSFDVLFSIQSQMEFDDYLDRGVASKDLLPLQSEPSDKSSVNNFNPISLLKMGTKWIEEKLDGFNTQDLKNYTISILSCIDKLNIANRYRHPLETLKQNPTVEFLYKCVDRYELLYVSDEDNSKATNSDPKDILFCADIDDSIRQKLIELIVKYFKEPTQQRRAKNGQGFTILSTAQKSVIALLIEKEYLHPSIDTSNAKERHRLTSLFIEKYIEVDNVSYSSKYNEAKAFQDYEPNMHIEESKEHERYTRFFKFVCDFEEAIKNN